MQRILRIKTLTLILVFSIFMLLLNYQFFLFCLKDISFDGNKTIFFTLPIIYFILTNFIYSILLMPYVWKFIAVLTVLISSLSAYFMGAYGVILDSEMIRNVFETNPAEAASYLNFNLVLWLVFTCILPIIYIIKVKVRYANFKQELIKRVSFTLGCLVVLGVFSVFLTKTYMPFFREHNHARFYNLPFYPIYSTNKFIKKRYFYKKEEFKIIAADATRVKGDRQKILIFIVGEAARSANYSLNGYKLHDTNKFTQAKDVVSLPDFYSCGTATAQSVPCMFSNLGRENFSVDKANNQENAIDILAKTGVDVYWAENDNGCKGVCDRMKNVIQRDVGMDTVLLEDAKNWLEIAKKDDNDTAIFIHIIGSHGPTYFERYPKEFAQFSPSCETSELKNCSSEEIVNVYDNTILYTDFIMSNLIDMLKEQETNADVALFYLSDHGESLGENGIYLHGLPYAIAPDEQKHIPAIAWFGESLKDKKQNLQNVKGERFSQDNVFHSLLGFFDINTSVYKQNLDLFNIK
ncbi:phosphoethanolamine transferase [Campylobacter curvus]|uniref:phosphoethanolamine transferase n=1 Tax=Campylobacter curvus TaxID=200 RepID=UPI0003710FA3|nr:phosphoethanolamine--lipid A transferase [Campylobacter curvus]QKF60429.1 phosphoethanolamine transferase [Campylobacter curvus]UEB50573.1 phosphoethanolamine--lipid A transferase [Campylobacter curvus]